MVCADSKQTPLDSMAMGLERSKTLHNFTLPFLKWGNQRYLRCMKLDSDGPDADGEAPPPADRRSPALKFNYPKFQTERSVFFRGSAKRLRGSKSKIERNHDNYDGDEGIAAVREKLMIDLKTAADQMKVAFWRDGVVDGEEEEEEDDDDDITKPEKKSPASASVPAPAPAEELRPWSLRVRRAASKAPIDTIGGGKTGGKALKIEKKPNRNSPLRSGDGRRLETEKKEREKFSVSLSKKEIEEDFMAMMERRPPRRPKKRPRIVQNQMDTLFPGLWLTEITADLYEVPEIQKNEKR